MAGITQARLNLFSHIKEKGPLNAAEFRAIASNGLRDRILDEKLLKKTRDKSGKGFLYSLTQKGEELLNTPADEISKRGRPANKSALKPFKAAAKSMAPAVAVVKQEPALMVSPDCNLMIENVQTVIHQNALYRDVLMNALNSMAAQLGMKVVPIDEITIAPSNNNKKD